MVICLECKRDNRDVGKYTCDLCGGLVCSACTKVTATEQRALELNRRVLKYFCGECTTFVSNAYSKPKTAEINTSSTLKTDDEFFLKIENLIERATINMLGQLSTSQDSLKIENIISQKTEELHDKIEVLRTEVKILKEGNIDLVRLLTNSPAQAVSNKSFAKVASKSKCSNCSKPYYSVEKTHAEKSIITTGTIASTEHEQVQKSQRQRTEKQKPANDRQDISALLIPCQRPKADDSVDTRGSTELSENVPVLQSQQPILSDTPAEWVTVKGRRAKKERKVIRSMVGSRESDNIALKSVPKLVFFHVSKLAPDTTERQLVDYLKPVSSFSSCEKLVSRYPEVYSSFKIGVEESKTDKIYVPSFWPEGTRVSRFFRRKAVSGAET